MTRKTPEPGKSFGDLYPEDVKHWDWEANGELTPYMFTPMNNAYAHWKCEEYGHKWTICIADKARYKSKCPTCQNDIILPGFNDFATTRPDILHLWDFEKNTVKPTEVSDGSNTQVWWKCQDHPHSWWMNIKSVSQGRRCAVCHGKQLLTGFNDLATKAPHLIAEWDWEANGELTPSTVLASQRNHIHWKCRNYGHTWASRPHGRVNRRDGCPYCASRLVWKGFNDLMFLFPALMSEWDWEENSIRPDEVTAYSPQSANWKCGKGHTWLAIIDNRTRAQSGCPKCSTQNSKIEEAFYDALSSNGNFKVTRGKKLFVNWDNNKRANVDIFIEFKKAKVVVEYDGSYWHRNKMDKDLSKTKALLSAGYKVVRIRENGLSHLNYMDLSLLQLDYAFGTPLEKTLKEIVNFVKMTKNDPIMKVVVE